ncbi:MAG: hypothetical protein FWH21_10185 [Kiritimatiellaeota bacterium]|nr:hypothetical protein [Kiritimatiellota bacterium]
MSEALPFPPVEVDYFYESGCPECAVIDGKVLPPLQASYGDLLLLRRRDINVQTNYLLLAAYQEMLNVPAEAPVSIVVDRQFALAGLAAIRDSLPARVALAIDARLKSEERGEAFELPPPPDPLGMDALADRLADFTPPLVMLAGLADGLNPCAFATIVFLVSLLALGGRGRRGILVGGLSFCVASYATYFLIGLGLLSFLRELAASTRATRIINGCTGGLLLAFGAVSVLDAWRYWRTGNAKAVILQLPDSVKRRIRAFAESRWRGPAVLGTGLLCGAAVTILESVCTGQLYLPTIVLMSRSGTARHAWVLLALYNLAFIIPLFAVFLASAFGVRSQRLADWSRHHVAPSKLLLAAVFILLAAVLLRSAF